MLAELDAIAAQGLPVLCLDTCTALDLLRNPAREAIRPHERVAAIELLAAAEQGQLIVLIADQVALEINENLPSVVDEAVKGLNGVKILWFEAPEIAERSDYFPACGVHLGQHTFLPK